MTEHDALMRLQEMMRAIEEIESWNSPFLATAPPSDEDLEKARQIARQRGLKDRHGTAIDALIAWSLDPEAVSRDEADHARAEAWGYDSDEVQHGA